jgi:hypothetical protein
MRPVKVYIFGASGFIGTSLSQQLIVSKIYHFRVLRGSEKISLQGGIYSKDLTLDQAVSEISITQTPLLVINCIGLTRLDSDNCFPDMLKSNYEIPLRISKTIQKNPMIKLIHLSTELLKTNNQLNREQYKLTKKIGDEQFLLLEPNQYQIVYLPLVLSKENKSSRLITDLQKMVNNNHSPELVNPDLLIKFCTLHGIGKMITQTILNFVSHGELSQFVELSTYCLMTKEIVELRRNILECIGDPRKVVIQRIRHSVSKELQNVRQLDDEEMNEVLTVLENL